MRSEWLGAKECCPYAGIAAEWCPWQRGSGRV